MSAQNIKATTQKFTEIVDIIDEVVLLNGGNACMIIEVRASNFALLSAEEQEAKIVAYASLLNSLSFSIQILIRNKKIDISSYLKLLEQEVLKAQTTNQRLSEFISLYRDFVEEIVRVNTVLDKNFYLVVPYSSLEKGVTGVLKDQNLITTAKAALQNKVDGLLNQLARVGLPARVLEKEELIKLFYDLYNPSDDNNAANQIEDSIREPVVKAQL